MTVSVAAVVRSISWTAGTYPNGTSYPAGMLMADAVVEERADDEMVITENPVENGSVTTDHAYALPSQLELTYAFDPGGVQNTSKDPYYLRTVYTKLLGLELGRVLLSVVTGKRQYKNLLIKALSVTTERTTENVLMIRVNLQQLILTTTQTVSLSSSAQQSMPGKTAAPINRGNVSLGDGSSFKTKITSP